MYMYICIYVYTADPTWGDIFECCFKAQSSKLERLFSLKRGKRDVRALSCELSKMTPQVGLAVHTYVKLIYIDIHKYNIYIYIYIHIYESSDISGTKEQTKQQTYQGIQCHKYGYIYI